jgi:putative transposase
VVVSYETMRDWSLCSVRLFANTLRRRRPEPGNTWFMNEVFLRIWGKARYLWREVADVAGAM